MGEAVYKEAFSAQDYRAFELRGFLEQWQRFAHYRESDSVEEASWC